jgi:hypothetical protein
MLSAVLVFWDGATFFIEYFNTFESRTVLIQFFFNARAIVLQDVAELSSAISAMN